MQELFHRRYTVSMFCRQGEGAYGRHDNLKEWVTKRVYLYIIQNYLPEFHQDGWIFMKYNSPIHTTNLSTDTETKKGERKTACCITLLLRHPGSCYTDYLSHLHNLPGMREHGPTFRIYSWDLVR